ncbi:MAG: ABC transporter ATP-binding protein, partial [Phycisphaerae bacterium]
RTITSSRLAADLDTFISPEDQPELRGLDRSIRIVRLDDASPLAEHVRATDLPVYIVGIDQGVHTAGGIYDKLAYWENGRSLTLQIVTTTARRDQEPPRRITFTPGDTDRAWRLARWGAGLLPAGDTSDEKLRALALVLAGMLVVQLIGGAARFSGEYMIALVAGRTLVGIRRQMYRKLLRLPVSYFAQRGTTDVMSRFVQDSQDIYRGLTYIFVQSIREPLKALGVFAVALFLNWRITLLAVVVAPLAAFVIRSFGRSIRKRSRRLLEGYARMLRALEGALTGIRVVKGYNAESYERRHMYQVDVHMFRQQAGIERIEALTSPLFEIIGYFFGAAITVYFAGQVMSGTLMPGEFMVLVLCLGAMFDPVRKLSKFYNRIERANAAAERIFEVIDMPDEKAGASPRLLPPLSDGIEFRDVRFTYPGAERPAVDGLSLQIRRGERIAIVGPNGSGKTTLVSLLMRFFNPQEGAILFDGVDIRSVSIQSLRRQLGIVTQDAVIFADTVRNNIAYGDPSLLWKLNVARRHPNRRMAASNRDERVVAAARAAFADEFISQMPDRYDTMVGEHGATLSGGQKQRLSIARAILANAPILIFDEATSQIDADSEQKIHDALEHFLEDRTAFIIAHRFSTIMQADRIVVMNQGRLVDSGKHDVLIDRCSLYQTLFETQFRPALLAR